VKQAIDSYDAHLSEKGTIDIGRNETVRRLRTFFGKPDALLSSVTPKDAEELYENFRRRTKEDGAPISVSYHRATLINARSLFKWCVRNGLADANPFAAVEGVGRRNAGKDQWTGDETRKFFAYALPLVETGDKAALACLMALLMALRSSDITKRVVRDVDLDATVLRVTHGKTAKSNRPRRIPELLQPMLRKLVDGRSPFEPLFRSSYTDSGHYTRRWLEQALEKFCEGCGVPRVVPHALKGTAGTLLAATGELADRIADHLSHEEAGTTRKHYVAPGTVEAAQAARALTVIAGGRR
jgi:integrase